MAGDVELTFCVAVVISLRMVSSNLTVSSLTEEMDCASLVVLE